MSQTVSAPYTRQEMMAIATGREIRRALAGTTISWRVWSDMELV